MASNLKTNANIWLLPLMLCVCTAPKSSTDQEINAMEFEVVDSLLQKPIVDNDLKISFRPPMHWKAVANDSVIREINRTVLDKNPLSIRAHIFYDARVRSIFILDGAPHFNRTRADSLVKKIALEYKSRFPKSEFKTALFAKNEFIVHQIILNLGALVVVSLFFDATSYPPFETRFILPFNGYSEEMKKVESVVGSISLLKAVPRY